MSLQIENLSFGYKGGETRIFDNFCVSVEEGKVLAVQGKSGCGKTTLLRIISGLEEGASGLLRVGERVLQDKKTFVPVEKRNVGFVFQDYALFPFMTVAQNIKFGMKKYSAERLDSLLELTRLMGLKKRYPHELSGGQQQRVAIARTLASNPPLLLMDEPFSNLDADLAEDLRRDLLHIIRSHNITTVIATHNNEDAEYLADKIIRLG